MKPVLKALWSLASGKWRCGVCLFELGFGIRPLEIDIIGSYPAESVFWSSDTHEFSYADIVRSSQRECSSCKEMIEAFNTFEVSFQKAAWYPRRFSERPRLVLDETKQVFELCVSPENYTEATPTIQPCICTGTKIPGSTKDPASLNQAAQWLAACKSNHKHCDAQDASFQPTRLLFLGDEDQKTIRLVENEARITTYAALSHRWSEETQQVRLELANMADRKRDGINLEAFPPMMKDAISVLHRLRIFYVWIDCMCIIQDDKEDWTREAATMASVYANAELTLAATSCTGSGQSLFNDNTKNNCTAFDVRDTNGAPIFLRQVWPHYTGKDAEEGVAEAEWPLHTRAWWYDSGDKQHFPGTSIYRRPASHAEWSQIISEYTKRNVTFKSDTLPALAGVAKSFGRYRPDVGEYLCGLWSDQLASCFFWYLTEPASARPERGKIPSWSWASVVGNVACWGVSLEGIEFLGGEVGYHGDPYMGNVEVAKLTLRGSVAPATIYYGRQWADLKRQISADPALENGDDTDREGGDASFGLKVGDQYSTFQPDYQFDDSSQDLTYIASGIQVVCLTFGRITGMRNDPEKGIKEQWISAVCLLLRCVDENRGLYERIGVCRSSHIGNRLDLDTTIRLSQPTELTVV